MNIYFSSLNFSLAIVTGIKKMDYNTMIDPDFNA
jgi:hypothetical protein